MENKICIFGDDVKIGELSSLIKRNFPNFEMISNEVTECDICLFLQSNSSIKEILSKSKLSICVSQEEDLSVFKGTNFFISGEQNYAKQVSSLLYTNVEQFFDYVITLSKFEINLRQAFPYTGTKNGYAVLSEKFKNDWFVDEDELFVFSMMFANFMVDKKDARKSIEMAKYYTRKVSFDVLSNKGELK